MPTSNDAAPAPAVDAHAAGLVRRRWAQNVLPLATSLSLHVGLIVVGVALYHAVRQTTSPNRDQVVIPETTTLSHNPTLPTGSRVAPTDPLQHVADVKYHDPSGGFRDLPGDTRDSAGESFIGPSAPRRPMGIGNGTGGGPWTVPGSGSGPIGGIDIVGVPSVGNDVVFLCDASGSMVGVFGQLKVELKRSISQLRVDGDVIQKFNVIFFADGDARVLFPGGLTVASPDAKRRADEFIDDQVSTGGTDPMPAVRLAMAERPDVVYVLTDGFDQIADLNTVVDAFRRGNPDGRTHVNCIFLQADEDPKLVAALKRIADDGHGTFKAILKKDM